MFLVSQYHISFQTCILSFPSSIGQDEEMDTTPLAQIQPFFTIDKQKETDSSDKRQDQGDDGDSGQDEDLDFRVEDEEDAAEVSATKKASTKQKRLEKGENTTANGSHRTDSQESSEEEDSENDEDDQITVQTMKSPQCQTLSWQDLRAEHRCLTSRKRKENPGMNSSSSNQVKWLIKVAPQQRAETGVIWKRHQ